MDNLVAIVLDLTTKVVPTNNFCPLEGMRSFPVYVGMSLLGFPAPHLHTCQLT